MRYNELSTPALTIDLDAMQRNLEQMAASCRQQGVGLRPHTKTHKTPEVARRQLESGALGLTVAKVGEAEVMAAAGLDDILVAYPILGADKLRRLVELSRTRRMIVALDSVDSAQEISCASSEQGCTVEYWLSLMRGFTVAACNPARRPWKWRTQLPRCRGLPSAV